MENNLKWITPEGSLGSIPKHASLTSQHIFIVAEGGEGSEPISYTIEAGELPTDNKNKSTINPYTGDITGGIFDITIQKPSFKVEIH